MLKKLILLAAVTLQTSTASQDLTLHMNQTSIPSNASFLTSYNLDTNGNWEEMRVSEIVSSDSLSVTKYSGTSKFMSGPWAYSTHETSYEKGLMSSNSYKLHRKRYSSKTEWNFKYNSNGLPIEIRRNRRARYVDELDSLIRRSYDVTGKALSDTVIVTLGVNPSVTDTFSAVYHYSSAGILEKKSYCNISDSLDFGETVYEYASAPQQKTIEKYYRTDSTGTLQMDGSRSFYFENSALIVETGRETEIYQFNADNQLSEVTSLWYDFDSNGEKQNFGRRKTFSFPDSESGQVSIKSSVSTISNRSTLLKKDNRLHYSLSSGNSGRIQIFSINGRVMKSAAVTNAEGTISLSGISKGVYLVRITGTSGAAEIFKIDM